MQETTRRRRRGDRKDGRLLRSMSPMDMVAPYIMPLKSGATNSIMDEVDLSSMDRYIHEKRAQGMEGFGILHVLVAAYVRTVSQKPGINRFISGHRIYARYDVEIMLTVKKKMALNAPETVVSVVFPREDTAKDVYERLNREIYAAREEDNGMDDTARVLNYIPRPIKRGTVKLLGFMDYYDLIPRQLTRYSPFHGSMFLTSMGSLGIPPVVHHLYDFGNVPAFLSFGKKEKRYELNAKGEVEERRFIRYCVSLDDRICDGFYYASAVRVFHACLKNPWVLDTPPEQVVEDIE